MISEKRKNAAAILLLLSIVIMTAAEWNFYTWYEAVTPYGTLFASVMLMACFFCLTNVRDALHDPVFWLMAVTDAIALLNLFLIRSHFGAILTIADFMLICYLSNKLVIPKKLFVWSLVLVAFFFFYWTIDVKGYFKGYNTNYGGLILISGFCFLMILVEYIRGRLRERDDKKGKILLWVLLLAGHPMQMLQKAPR